MSDNRVMLGMSGGVDSSVAAYLLKKQGYDVYGCTLTFHKPEDTDGSDERDAAAVAKAVGIPHFTADYTEIFDRLVKEYFTRAYLKGETPNPCTFCNKNVKFPCMAEFADSKGCGLIATGHYAKIEKHGDRYLLFKGKDPKKDQSYMLYSLGQDILSRTVFPLGDLSKEQIREIALEIGLHIASKKDSQDICFIKDGEYADFIRKRTGEDIAAGDFCGLDGNIIGKHKGIIHYTVGQRKGLGISSEEPYYVVSKDAMSNKVVLGRETDLYTKRVYVMDTKFIPFDSLEAPLRVSAKLRYSQKESICTAFPCENGMILEFDEPQRAVTPGQAAVLYDGNMVIGGGCIKS